MWCAPEEGSHGKIGVLVVLNICICLKCTCYMHCARCSGRSDYWKDVLASSDSEERYQRPPSKEQNFFNFDFLLT